MKKTLRSTLAAALWLVGAAAASAQQASPAAPKIEVQKIEVNPGAAAPGTAGGVHAAPGATAVSTGEVPGVDFSKLSPEQKKTALKIMDEEKCNCGCGYTLYGCRTKDQKCPVSPGLANGVVTDLLAGKSEADVRKGLAPPATPPPPPPLETKVNNFDLTGTPIKGAKDAKVTIVEYSEFQCPWCGRAQPWLKEILAAYPNDVRLAFKHFPLPMHPHASFAAQASLAAHEQGKFWELHDKMFEDVKQLNPDNIKTWAKALGLDMVKFEKALADGTYKAKVEKEAKEGTDAGVNGTPSFFINGKKYNGGRDLASVRPVIDAELKGGSPAAAASPAAPAKPAAAKPDAKPAKPAAKKDGADGQ